MDAIFRWLSNRTSLGLMVGRLLTLAKLIAAAVGGVACWAQLTPGSQFLHPDLQSWVLWLLVAVGVMLAFDPGAWMVKRFAHILATDSRSNYLVNAFHKIREGTKNKANHSFNPSHELLLSAAVMELRDALGLGESLRTNLILALPPSKFRVAARSRFGSHLAEYEMTDKAAVTNAMKLNRAFVVTNAKSLKDGEQRIYRCVAAVPIAIGSKCYGAISVDSPGKRDFKGREAVLDRILGPYAAAILLTLSPEAPAYTCKEKHEA